MKRIYILKRADYIFYVSSNLLTAYNALVAHKLEFDQEFLRSYMQVTRIFHKTNYYALPSFSGPKWELLRLDVHVKFDPKLPH